MTNIKKFLKLPELYCVLVAILSIVGILYFRVTVENVVLIKGDTQENLSLPVSQKMERGDLFQIELDVSGNSSYDLKVIPDDCADAIIVNGESLNLNEFHGRCDFNKGFVLSDSLLAAHRIGNRTHYTFYLRNNGGNAGLNVFVLQTSGNLRFLHVLAVIAFALLCFFVALRLKLGPGIALVIFLTVLLRTFFFINISYTTYSNDVDGHVAYVQYILEKHEIPPADACWSCYHPAFYYLMSSPSFVLGEWVGIPGPSGLQVFSLLLSVLTLFFGIFFLKGFMKGSAFGIASVLWAFWPLMILVSPRVGNDQMFYLLHTICLWCGINYLNKGHGKYLIVSVIAAALAMWTKTTAAVTIGTVFLFAVCGYAQKILTSQWRPSRSEVVAAFLFVALIAGVLLQKLLGTDDLVGNASGLNSRLRVPNEAFSYIFFDLKSFVTNPFTSAWNDDMGRLFFWNFALKTSLFGEFTLSRLDIGRTFATFVSVSLLGLIVYAARGFWKTKLRPIHWILLLQSAAFVAAMMFLRIKLPYSCSNDFRFIAPVILCFVPFVAWGIHVENGSTKWKVFGYAIVAGFVLSTVVLYILAVK